MKEGGRACIIQYINNVMMYIAKIHYVQKDL